MPSFEQVDFAYTAGRLVLEGFSLELPDRGVVCLVGPSGCGKTTLLRLAAGLESPHAGRISGFQGRRAAMVFQEDRLLPWETTRQNATTTPSSDRATEWLVALGLGDSLDRRPGELSGGMARRVAIARALAAPHDLLLLDEPFSGLDEDTWRGAVQRILATEEGGLTLLVTHVLDQALAMGATVVRLQGLPLRVVGQPS
jgi:NitT/TauT family transport system ATP-binding protein